MGPPSMVPMFPQSTPPNAMYYIPPPFVFMYPPQGQFNVNISICIYIYLLL